MSVTVRRGRLLAVVALVTAGAVAGCSSGGGSSDKDKKITLSIGTFGTFGYKEDKPAIDLLAEYTKQHPNVKIVQHKLNSDPHHQQLAQHLAAGSGVDDIEAIEEGYIAQFKAHPQQFVNLLDMGASKLKDNWASWKWNQSMTADGKTQIGLGTDVGPLAMCYRTDLFAQAGLPTDRQAVSALWPTWDAYINAGKTFVSKVPSSHWVDAATNTYNTILMQQGDHTYFDKKNAFVMSSNPSVRKAWDITMQMINAKESANLAAFQDPWNAGFKNGAFATIACPSWMVGYIQGQAGDAGNGKWDVASLPGGGGNWGGSFLTLPKIGKHHKEAYDLAVWLTSQQQQLKVFQVVGNFPSAVKLYDKPELTGFKNAYMNNAPVGQIFVDGAKKNKPVYLGPTNGAVRLAVENDIRLVEQGRSTSDDAWQRALTDGKKAAS